MNTPPNEQNRKHREDLRAAGLRCVEIWVPDAQRENFVLCKRQSRLLLDDPQELDSADWAQAFADINGWQ